MKFFILAALCLVPVLSQAQETTASGALHSEASWNALQNRINTTNGNVAILRADVDAILKCHKDGKIWNGTTCISSGTNRWIPIAVKQASGPSLGAIESNLTAYAKQKGATRTCKLRLQTSNYTPVSYEAKPNSELAGFPCSNQGEACYTLNAIDVAQKDGSPFKHGRQLDILSCN